MKEFKAMLDNISTMLEDNVVIVSRETMEAILQTLEEAHNSVEGTSSDIEDALNGTIAEAEYTLNNAVGNCSSGIDAISEIIESIQGILG